MEKYFDKSLQITSDKNNIYYRGKSLISTSQLQFADDYSRDPKPIKIGNVLEDKFAVTLPLFDKVNISLFRNVHHYFSDKEIITYAVFKYIPIVCNHYIDIFKIIKHYKYFRLRGAITTIVEAIIRDTSVSRVITDVPFLVTPVNLEVIDINEIDVLKSSIYKYKEEQLTGLNMEELIPEITDNVPTLVMLSTNKILTYMIAKSVGGGLVFPLTIITSKKISTNEAYLL